MWTRTVALYSLFLRRDYNTLPTKTRAWKLSIFLLEPNDDLSHQVLLLKMLCILACRDERPATFERSRLESGLYFSFAISFRGLVINKEVREPASSITLNKIAISRPRFNRFWRNLARWCISNLLTVPTVKNLKFYKSNYDISATVWTT